MKLLFTEYLFSNTDKVAHRGTFKNIDNGIVQINISHQNMVVIYKETVNIY